MEILRFEEATTTAPKRKKSSKGYLTAGFVAALFGIGSAFASNTIAINGNAPIALGQGVTIVTECDTSISISPITSMTVEAGGPKFYMNELQIGDVNTSLPGADGLGCGGATFDIQIFDAGNNPYTCTALNPGVIAQEQGLLGAAQALTCGVDNKLSFKISSLNPGDRDYTISFTNAPSDISFITLVSR
jgi:hypothetical protein